MKTCPIHLELLKYFVACPRNPANFFVYTLTNPYHSPLLQHYNPRASPLLNPLPRHPPKHIPIRHDLHPPLSKHQITHHRPHRRLLPHRPCPIRRPPPETLRIRRPLRPRARRHRHRHQQSNLSARRQWHDRRRRGRKEMGMAIRPRA